MAQPVGELARVAPGELAVDEQAEPLREREGVDLGGVEPLGQGLGHPGVAELLELVHGRISQHRGVLSGITEGAADVVVVDGIGGFGRLDVDLVESVTEDRFNPAIAQLSTARARAAATSRPAAPYHLARRWSPMQER